ncbi:hypothetical protein HKX54_17275 [Sulfitobacter sp. M57]|uniref:hypothetical protein n=1 Tax=unclassified Sulfitobacter TaxID=196795 RepID=UPI0023E208A3|nr:MULTISPECIES: hypothetical protein [unclassified Sulfitobacter]MDF3416226.1 hypothetical protein [Sulfitobacter sp. KE5]MDF3423705.1 hypothetical protein [Sulfitobacter sp. KE43]MDF3434772.1 hypothetical protein [Sulfitobacter sp. KE42]MDF3460411.1 hypothetical protein [Sulfitobacter sp. S74]MDF3464309.1 hypothetical protein [Sulfitobacter sp. Ks18]
MAYFPNHARLRDLNSCVKIPHVSRLIHICRQWIKQARHPHIKDVSPHIARDVGLSETDLAAHRHQLPSQHTHHPRG